MRYKNYLIGLLLLAFSYSSVKGQDFDVLRSMNYSLDILQIKDGLNYGLVFTGPMNRFSYKKSWEVNGKDLMYQGDFGIGFLVTKGIRGVAFRVKLVDIFYNIYERRRTITFAAGPWVKMDYNYQLYPDLQNGYSFHATNYTLGLALSAKYQTEEVYLRLRWKNSLAGLISRSPEVRDPYFFELSLGTYFRDQHQNFSAGSFNLYNNTSIELLYVNPNHPRLGYAYSFEYFSYNNSPELKMLSHSFSLFFYPKT